jgi:hypothetical protein
MATVQAKQSVTDELEVGNKLNVSVSASGSASIRLFQGPTQLSATQLAAGSSTDFGPFINSINYAVDCYSGIATTTETKSSTAVGDAAGVISVPSSRTLTQADNGCTLDCAEDVILTIPPGLTNFGCALRPEGVQIACGSGVTINGDDETLTTTARVGAINPTATANAYDVVGV